jgi:alkylhydroperoxidase family enzyme
MSVTEAQLADLAAGRFEAFEPAWGAALMFADVMTRSGGPVDDVHFAELATHYSTEQIVEITAVAALFNYFNRFANSLNIPVTR